MPLEEGCQHHLGDCGRLFVREKMLFQLIILHFTYKVSQLTFYCLGIVYGCLIHQAY